MIDQLVIKNFTTAVIDEPLKRPFITHLHKVTAIHAVQVKLTLANGLTGTGAATPNEKVTGDTMSSLKEAIDSLIGPQLVGKSLNHLEELMNDLATVIRYNEPAKAAFDMAIYDLLSQVTKMSLPALFGGAKEAMETDYTISIGSQKQMVASARELVAEGFTALKIKIGNSSVAEDVATVTEIAAAVGPKISLRLDVNQGWNYKQARRALAMLEERDLNIAFVEQPLAADQIAETTRLRMQTTIPIMLDESVFSPADALRVIRADAADYVNIKLMKCGGLFQAAKINDLCATAGIGCMVGCMIESQVGLAAGLAFALGHQNVKFIDLDSCFMAKDSVMTLIDNDGPNLMLK